MAMRLDLREIVTLLVSYFQEKPDILAVYLFGSVLTNYFQRESDIDIAVLPEKPLSAEEKLALVGDLSALLPYPVDVVDLRSCGPILGVRVLQQGKKVWCKDEFQVKWWAMHLLSEYFDFIKKRKPMEEKLLQSFLKNDSV